MTGRRCGRVGHGVIDWVRFDLPVLEPEEMSRDELIVVVRRQAGQISRAGRADRGADGGQRGPRRAGWPGWSICCRATRGTPRTRPRKMTIRASPRRRTSSVVGVGRSGRGASSPGRRGRIWRGPMTPNEQPRPVPARAAATAARTWPAPGIWVWSTATSSTRSRRSRSPSPSTTSIRCACGCGAAAHRRPAGRGPVRARSGTAPTWQAFAVYLMVVHFIPAHRSWRCWSR